MNVHNKLECLSLAGFSSLQPSLIFANKAGAYLSGVPFRSSALGSAPGSCIIKLITVVIYGFRNKLECLYLNARLGWKGLPGTNALAFYGNRKLRP
jgi:hypothetical protein